MPVMEKLNTHAHGTSNDTLKDDFVLDKIELVQMHRKENGLPVDIFEFWSSRYMIMKQ